MMLKEKETKGRKKIDAYTTKTEKFLDSPERFGCVSELKERSKLKFEDWRFNSSQLKS